MHVTTKVLRPNGVGNIKAWWENVRRKYRPQELWPGRCVNLCVKELRKIGWDFGFRVIAPFVMATQPIETKGRFGCGGWI